MPLYIQYTKPASRDEYKLWLSIGYAGSWEQYQAAKSHTAGGRFFINGDLGPHCADCASLGEFLCDYPVGEAKTCDRAMCSRHAKEVGEGIHYCRGHWRMWDETHIRDSAEIKPST